MEDKVNHPEHYNKGGIECIEAIKASMTPEEFLGFLKGNCLKYLWRAGSKPKLTIVEVLADLFRGKKTYKCIQEDNKQEDIEKAKWYLERYHKEIGTRPSWVPHTFLCDTCNTCNTCKFEMKERNEEPCVSCDDTYDKYQPGETNE